MTGFGGRSFEFIGQPNTIYSLISEKFHKVLLPLPAIASSIRLRRSERHVKPDTERARLCSAVCYMQDTALCTVLVVATCPRGGSFVLTQHACMQVSTKLKVGVMWDHNGTYMEGFGFQYRDHQITVEITQDDQIAGQSLALPAHLTLGQHCPHRELCVHVHGCLSGCL